MDPARRVNANRPPIVIAVACEVRRINAGSAAAQGGIEHGDKTVAVNTRAASRLKSARRCREIVGQGFAGDVDLAARAVGDGIARIRLIASEERAISGGTPCGVQLDHKSI